MEILFLCSAKHDPYRTLPAYNNGNHDARLLYIMVLASCRAHHIKKDRATNHAKGIAGVEFHIIAALRL
ncbi:MAG TPA: hypothetical protein VLX91_03960 [Candidatus Acidoferrales bacterium]|nr:hypothetical protein [Candidatus Acidoferrales bacterium]